MKNFLAAAALAVVVATGAGCYKTQQGGYKMGIPFSKDTIESRYERPVDQVFAAAKATLVDNGALIAEVAAKTPDSAARTLEARINERNIWIRIDEVEPRITRILVQARKISGRGDVDLAAELDKQVALRLR